MSDKVKIAIIGSGPSGLSCAAHAAELKVPHLLLEAEEHPSHTIFRYQKGKHVMAEPGILPLRSPMTFTAGKREVVLGKWNEELDKYKVNVRHRANVNKISGTKGDFEIKTAAGETYQAENVVLCIGLQGNIRMLGVPGEDLERVQYQLDDPDEYGGETIVVVGAGDAGIENALGLAENNRVILINRVDEFPRVKQGNIDLVTAAISSGKMECRFSTSAIKVEQVEGGAKPLKFTAQTPSGVEEIPCDRMIARLGAIPPRKLVESFGIKFPNQTMEAVPQVSATYESNVPGLYIIGALGGYPLIKQAMNQGYEVVEYILGNAVEPADEDLLKAKFRNFKRAKNVSDALALVQTNVPLFKDLTTLQLREFMLDSEVLNPQKGELIFKKDDYTNTFFSIVDGEVMIEVPGNDGKFRNVPLAKGQFFGELGLLSGRRRSGTVRAGDNCVLIETPRRSMLKLIASIESVRRQIDQTSLRRAVRTQVARMMSDADLDEMVAGAVIKTFAAGQTIFKEGDAADGLHLIRRGSVTISRVLGGKEVVLAYVAAGNYVGEMALLSSEAKRTATVRAAVTCETILLEAKAFNEVLSRNQTWRGGIEAAALERMSKNVQRETEPDPGNLISFLIGQGLGEGTDVLLIDESLCVRCDNCEKACADVHDGTSRLDRQAGPTFANIHVPTSCRHCENPHCMKECPPDAIHRNANGEVYIADTCIGCGNCQRNCPYGVIQMSQVNPKRHAPSLWAWLLSGLTTEPGREEHYHNDELGKKAVKCDMCKDLAGGPACVRACPTGAAVRVSPERFIAYAGK
ncbi:MAG TPA: cyclic nucleotide-binding domain-containing protein [Burkholderiales bacterium]|nr:cyclic nucleotide-binding domain-containing protein [Burkholderiales bacterium]